MSISYLSAGLPLGLCNLLIRAGYGLALNLRRGEKQATAAVTCCPLLLCACNNSSSTIITIVAITIQLSCPRIIISMCVVLRSVGIVADAQRWGQNGMLAKNHCDTG